MLVEMQIIFIYDCFCTHLMRVIIEIIMLIVIAIAYVFNNNNKITGKFVHVTVTIVQRP